MSRSADGVNVDKKEPGSADGVIDVHINDEQQHITLDHEVVTAVVRAIVADAGYTQAEIGIAVVDDERIAQLHGEYLDDPTPTDTMSWVLEADGDRLEGEVVASAETAAGRAPEFNQPAERELLLYIIHGTLHLVGYDDRQPESRATMQEQEQRYLEQVSDEQTSKRTNP